MIIGVENSVRGAKIENGKTRVSYACSYKLLTYNYFTPNMIEVLKQYRISFLDDRCENKITLSGEYEDIHKLFYEKCDIWIWVRDTMINILVKHAEVVNFSYQLSMHNIPFFVIKKDESHICIKIEKHFLGHLFNMFLELEKIEIL